MTGSENATQMTETISCSWPTVRLTIKHQIAKFMSLARPYDPQEVRWSNGVSSKLAPGAVWKLQVKKDTWESLDATYHLYLVGEDGQTDSIHRGSGKFGAEGCYSRPDKGRISHERVEKALHVDGSLVVAADIEFLPPHDGQKAKAESSLHNKWHGSIKQLQQSGDYSDCVLKVGDEELKAHRLILSAVSPYFRRMFNSGFQEAESGVVTAKDPAGLLEDCSTRPYEAFLCYVYKGLIDWSIYGGSERDVLVLAEMYEVEELKDHIEGLLVDEINNEGVVELALFAELHHCNLLKEACIHYFKSHRDSVERILGTRADLLKKMHRLAN